MNDNKPTSVILSAEDVEWVVNDIAELGVKIGQQFFWLYKGHSLVYGDDPEEIKRGVVLNEDTDPPKVMHWRPVFKREFGECCHPINYEDLRKCGHPHFIGTVSPEDSDEWRPIPAAVEVSRIAPEGQAQPVAWMRPSTGDLWSAESKKKAESAEHGGWSVLAHHFNVPLYAAPQAVPAQAEITDTRRLDWLFANCRIVFYPPANGGPTPYPIEHNPHATGYGNKRDSTPILQFADAAMKGQP